MSKTKAIADELGADYVCADFSNLKQVRGLAEELQKRYPRIEVLADNAGSVFTADSLPVDGYDRVLQVNYLSPFLLTTSLLEVLIASKATIIGTSSSSQRLIRRGVTEDDLLCLKPVRPTVAYGFSKITVVIFARELHRRYGGMGVSSPSFHHRIRQQQLRPGVRVAPTGGHATAHTERLVGITPEAACDQTRVARLGLQRRPTRRPDCPR